MKEPKTWRLTAQSLGYAVFDWREVNIPVYQWPDGADVFVAVKSRYTNEELFGLRRAVIVVLEWPNEEVFCFDTFERETL